MKRALLLPAILVVAACGVPQQSGSDEGIDLLLYNARVWTGDEDLPWATWVAVDGETIESVGDDNAPPRAARAIDLGGRLVVPGFNDSHVHFASAGALLLGVNLLDVNDDTSFRERIIQTAKRLPGGSWITAGDWGAYEAWEVGSEGETRRKAGYMPSRSLIDDVTAAHPVLVLRYDHTAGLANSAALSLLGLESETGILEGDVLATALDGVPEKTFERRRAEAQRALEECRRWGVTSVQDMSPLDQVDLYDHLRREGELTVRVQFSPSRLSDYEMMVENGWTIGAGDEWVRFGTIKTHVDGIMGNRTARFFEPYSDNDPEMDTWRGGWREFSEDLEQFEQMLTLVDAANIQMRVHAIGDEANSLLLGMLGRIEEKNGPKDRRFRLVHAQVFHPDDLKRLKDRGIVAEVQPYHCTDDMRWMEERIGHERSRGAYAFRSLEEAGCILSFGSDWPGTNASYYPINPILGLYAAVTRQTIKGTPAGGWFPEERISLEDALRAYTWGGAYSTFEEDLKGTITPGKLADLAVFDTNLFETPPSEWLDAGVDYTIVGGKVVFEAP